MSHRFRTIRAGQVLREPSFDLREHVQTALNEAGHGRACIIETRNNGELEARQWRVEFMGWPDGTSAEVKAYARGWQVNMSDPSCPAWIQQIPVLIDQLTKEAS